MNAERRSGGNGEMSRRRTLPVWLRAAVVAAALAALAGLLTFAVRVLDRSDFSSTTLAGPVARIDIQVARGDIELVPGTTEDIVVQRTATWRLRRPAMEAVVDGETLRIRSSCPRMVMIVDTCSVSHRIEVPAGVRVDVRTGRGAVEVIDLDSWLRIVTTDGDVDASGLAGEQVLIDSGGGNVSLAFVGTPSYVEVSSSGGNVVVRLPGGPYDAQVEPDGGEVTLEAPTEKLAERIVAVDSGGGDVALLPS